MNFGCYPGHVRNRVISATEFKAKCLSLLDEVRDKGDTITVTKRGTPVATLGPARKRGFKSSEGAWVGKVRVSEDLLSTEPLDGWDVLGHS